MLPDDRLLRLCFLHKELPENNVSINRSQL